MLGRRNNISKYLFNNVLAIIFFYKDKYMLSHLSFLYIFILFYPDHCTTNNPSSLLWRKCTSSSSIVNPHLQLQNPNQKSFSGINETITNSK